MLYCFTDFVDIDKIKEENVVGAFTYLFHTLGILFARVDFTKLKSVCMLRGAPLPQEFKQKIRAAQELDDILDALDDPLYCNWCNVRLLKRIAKNINNQKAERLIQIYEDNVYSRKVSDVKQYFKACFDEKTVSKVEIKINKRPDLTMKQVIDYCEKIENIIDIYTGAASVTDSNPGCLKITVVIPIHCSLHAFKMAKNNFFKFRQIHVQYLEIESFPKVFAIDYLDKENTLEALSLNTPNCKFPIVYIATYIRTYIAT